MQAHQPLIPIILSGGTGTRLWPVSRESHPKPFMQMPDGQSLLQKTLLRASSLTSIEEIITITNRTYYLKHKAAYEKVAPPHARFRFLLEPTGRNTAPALALSALAIIETHGVDAMMLALLADHLITNIESFQAACHAAFALANLNQLVTFGITPTTAETGFGYIECGHRLADMNNAYSVNRFIEKPRAELAETFLAAKNYLWNAGMFCFKAGVFLAELNHYAPELLKAATECFNVSVKNIKNTSLIDFDSTTFKALPDISIDYALMEKSENIAVLACDFDWQDIGSWESYKKLHPTDTDGNTVIGEAILIDSTNNFIQSDNRMIASIGISNLAVIDTPDALLITQRDRAQEVKQLVNSLKEKAHPSFHQHRTVERPWGTYTVLEEGPCFKIKRIVVNPGQSLSLQLHHHRSEHWIVVEGIAEVTNGDKTYTLQINESTFVPQETKHRLANPGELPLVMIEVQTGSYVGEDDIIRFEDVFGRVELQL